MSSKCSIETDREPAFYTAGDVIKGSLKFLPAAHKLERLFDLQLILTGGIGPWPMEGTWPFVNRRVTKIIIPLQHLCLTNRFATYKFCNSTENCILWPSEGSDPIPFEMQLPKNLFSSIMGHEGVSMYKLIAIASWGAPSPRGNKRAFRIDKDIYIVCLMPKIRPGYDLEIKKENVWNNPNKIGEKATLSVQMERRCAIGGEKIRFIAFIENGLHMPLGALKCILKQNITWTFPAVFQPSEPIVLNDVKIIVNKEGPTIPPGPGRKVEWSSEVEIPHVIPSGKGSDGFSSYNLAYRLMFAVTSRYVTLNVGIPFHVGTALLGSNEATLESAYFSEFSRSLSMSSLNTLSQSSTTEEDSDYWLSTSDVLSLSSGSSVPIYPADTPPPAYEN